MQLFEHKNTAVAATDLAVMGKDGWRLVSVYEGMMFWERPVDPEPAEEAKATPDAETAFFGRKIVGTAPATAPAPKRAAA